MKYIYYIISVATIISVTLGFSFFTQPSQEQDYVLKINGRQISSAEFELRYSKRRSRQITKNEFIDSLVLKELLIQEAKKTGVDQEEAFRNSIQDFYEQSLSKILMDRKFKEIQVIVSKDEIDRYMDLIGTEISLSMITPPSSENILSPDTQTTESVKVIQDQFDNLSTSIKMNVYPLSIGEQTTIIDNYDEGYIYGRYTLRLDSVKKNTTTKRPELMREKVEQAILEYKKEKQFVIWLDSLRTKALVQINKNILQDKP